MRFCCCLDYLSASYIYFFMWICRFSPDSSFIVLWCKSCKFKKLCNLLHGLCGLITPLYLCLSLDWDSSQLSWMKELMRYCLVRSMQWIGVVVWFPLLPFFLLSLFLSHSHFLFLSLNVPFYFVKLFCMSVAIFLPHLFIIFEVYLPAYFSNHNPF